MDSSFAADRESLNYMMTTFAELHASWFVIPGHCDRFLRRNLISFDINMKKLDITLCTMATKPVQFIASVEHNIGD